MGFIYIFEQTGRASYVQRPHVKIKQRDYGFMKFSEDQSSLLLSPLHGALQIFDTRAFPQVKLVRSLKVEMYSMFDRSFDVPVGSPVAFLTLNKADRVLASENWRTGKVALHLGHSQLIYTTRVGTRARKFFTGSYDHSVCIRNLGSRKLVQKLEKFHSNWVSVICLLSRERVMASTGFDKQVQLFDIENRTLLCKIQTGTFSCYAMLWDEARGQLLVGGNDKFFLLVIDQIKDLGRLSGALCED